METPYHLFMVLTGCRPKGRNTEQHDIFFGIAKDMRELVPEIKKLWPGTTPIHVDAWRMVTHVEGYRISVVEGAETQGIAAKLFFLNLGGYKENQFDELHYKFLAVSNSLSTAIAAAKASGFFRHTGFAKAIAHVDDKYGIDVDDAFEVKEILPPEMKNRFTLALEKSADILPEDEIHLGFFRLHEL